MTITETWQKQTLINERDSGNAGRCSKARLKDRYAPKRNYNFKKKQTKVTADDNNTARKLPTDNNSKSNYELLETA